MHITFITVFRTLYNSDEYVHVPTKVNKVNYNNVSSPTFHMAVNNLNKY